MEGPREAAAAEAAAAAAAEEAARREHRARLARQRAYNWVVERDKADQASAARLFAVPDFVGDICQLIGARVRSAASLPASSPSSTPAR